MALEMKATSRWWYGRIMVSGKLRRFPIMDKKNGQEQRVEIKGQRPDSLKHPERGDAAFLASYHRAKTAHDNFLHDELSKRSVEDLAQRIIEAKTGTRLDFVKVASIPDAWATIPRRRPPSPLHVEKSKGKLRRFTAFMRQHYPDVEDLAAVRADHVRAYLDAEAARGISPRTWNVALKLLKTVFVKLEPNADAFRAYLKNATFKDEETIHREPFKDEDLAAILAAAKVDTVLYGPMVTALCTAMRRGDCALLKWASVDLKAGFIEVRTSKTGETAEIPILPMLREILASTPTTGSVYVFPDAAELYQRDANALDRRLRAILVQAGFVDTRPGEGQPSGKEQPAEQRPSLPALPPDELRRRGLDAIANGAMIEAKRERMRATFTAYLDGKSLPSIASEHGISKSTVSLHLNEIEDMTGAAVIRRPVALSVPAGMRGALHADKGTGPRLRRGSIRGWHSFRVAFVTRALAGGMPEELVRRVTGHTAVEVVRRHYFKPGREEFRREFEKAMPQLAMNGAQSRDDQLREIVEGLTPKSATRDKARLLAILNGKA